MMGAEQIATAIESEVKVTREDIARAKSWLSVSLGGATDALLGQWLAEQSVSLPKTFRPHENLDEQIREAIYVYSLCFAFYRAAWELISTAEIVMTGTPTEWQPNPDYWTPHHQAGVLFKSLCCVKPASVWPLRNAEVVAADFDIFCGQHGLDSLDSGLLEALKMALDCFRRGFYMPAIAMLAAASEGAWIECGVAVARELSDSKLAAIFSDPLKSIAAKVQKLREVLESPAAKSLLAKAGQHKSCVDDATQWTTNLRDKRNALHWMKSRSFIVDHSEAASLLMGAPRNLGALESIRKAC